MILVFRLAMMGPAIATFSQGTGPLVATAIHAGSYMRRSLMKYCRLDRSERLREEDPFTERIAQVSGNRIIGERSRFEVDLNRPKDKAVYLKPEDAWGLDVWKDLPADELKASLDLYDQFYRECGRMFDRIVARHGHLIVLDIHSYNHQRKAPGVVDDPAKNPEVNLGTGNVDRERWKGTIERIVQGLKAPLADGRELDVRENVKFKGGHFTRWIYERYGERACALAIEYKKIFMDEWTGVPDMPMVGRLSQHLENATAPVLKEHHGPSAA